MPDTPVVDLDNLDDGRYVRYHAAGDEQRPEYDAHRREVRELCGAGPGAAVLEVGCGTGPHLTHFWRATGPGGRVVAVDSSGKMLDLARARLVETGVPLRDHSIPGVELVLG
jgi:SAM-dependent methyltransferase